MDERGAWMRKRGPDGAWTAAEWVVEAEVAERLQAGWRQAPADVIEAMEAAMSELEDDSDGV